MEKILEKIKTQNNYIDLPDHNIGDEEIKTLE
jgi:hypothetical protein